jgi:hypothetical protein
MKFPKFWSLGRSGPGSAWGWSDHSLEAAAQLAQERATKVANLLRAGTSPNSSNAYYADRPIREQVLRELGGSHPTAIISRNAYGAEILNSTTALFVDVDLPAPKKPKLLDRLFGSKAPATTTPSAAEVAALQAAEQWAKSHAGWSWRIYRTAAGLRLLATHQTFSPHDPVVTAAFEALGADPLYRQLCRVQQCFRARLTPKPWRVGVKKKTPEWPWKDAAAEQKFAKWDQSYRQANQGFATCELIQTVESNEIHPDLRELVSLHDQMCGVGSGQPLA